MPFCWHLRPVKTDQTGQMTRQIKSLLGAHAILARLYESTGRAIALPPVSALGVGGGIGVNKNV